MTPARPGHDASEIDKKLMNYEEFVTCEFCDIVEFNYDDPQRLSISQEK